MELSCSFCSSGFAFLVKHARFITFKMFPAAKKQTLLDILLLCDFTFLKNPPKSIPFLFMFYSVVIFFFKFYSE